MMLASLKLSNSVSRCAFRSSSYLLRSSESGGLIVGNNENNYYHGIRSFASISALIKELRASTGAPMMECKKALEAVDGGDLEEAAKWLRTNGSAKVLSKVSGREASEGLVGICFSSSDESEDSDVAAIVKVSSETDFASRSEAFFNLVKNVAEATMKVVDDDDDVSCGIIVVWLSLLSNVVDDDDDDDDDNNNINNKTSNNNCEGAYSVDVNQLLSIAVDNGNDGSSNTLKDTLEEAVLAIRENLSISQATAVRKTTDNSILAGYVHGKVCDFAGTSAALVEIASIAPNNNREDMKEIGKKLAMHVVAAKPTYLSPSDIPEDVLQKEKTILMEQMTDSGKPAHILEKIVNGRLRKFYESVCLTEQAHLVEEGNPKISKALAQHGVEVKFFKYNSILP
eukprot:CAMPEP_0197841824 /NCGR_PEP_ID=MMETSP1437-20131217/46395_1 /TAXON_ID=49252 ORGANISM="Eucampia antarctica, Strain CCMP1452" /NCGR_SAMPLE_ID=MMETSP1437 /ASSEMBLY_ACC=CAM_ASM_001096 /LENGTH=397 /DNA_ID=CAMNT_0043451627 /DNA_START=63 /DNA_END=1259 /DNA_ORIENTATION=-